MPRWPARGRRPPRPRPRSAPGAFGSSGQPRPDPSALARLGALRSLVLSKSSAVTSFVLVSPVLFSFLSYTLSALSQTNTSCAPVSVRLVVFLCGSVCLSVCARARVCVPSFLFPSSLMCFSLPPLPDTRAHTHAAHPPSARYHRRTLPLPLNSFHLRNRFAGRLRLGGPGFLPQEGLPASFPRVPPLPLSLLLFLLWAGLFLRPDPRLQPNPLLRRDARTPDGAGGAWEDDCHSWSRMTQLFQVCLGEPPPCPLLRLTHPEARGPSPSQSGVVTRRLRRAIAGNPSARLLEGDRVTSTISSLLWSHSTWRSSVRLAASQLSNLGMAPNLCKQAYFLSVK